MSSMIRSALFSYSYKKSRRIVTSSHVLIRRHHESSSNAEVILDLTATHIKVSSNTWHHHLKLNHLWLRDHCRCNACYNHQTRQRNVDLLSIPPDIKPIDCRVEDGALLVSWPDGHCSNYPLDWVWKNSDNEYLRAMPGKKPILWDSENVSKYVTTVSMDDYMKTEDGLKEVVKSLVGSGVGFVNNVPATIGATEEVVRRMALVQHTLFGAMWEFSNAEMVHSDTAYTSLALGAHNDNTYLNEAAGLQVFHCFRHNGTGGETLLVDGFNAAHQLQKTRPDCYNILTSTPIESEYLEPGSHYSAIAPVLRIHPITQELEQVRFNLYDRAPMSAIPSDKVPEYYDALRQMALAVRNASGEWWVKLRPGMVVFIDNWRVLHGRAEYTGLREMGGCYVGRNDYISKARVLGLL